MKNDYLEYYGEYHISPVRQDINNIEAHYKRRKKLYRQCGIPEIAFRNAEILEVGPGGGYNTLAFFHWNCKHIDLVEANLKGQEDMRILFSENHISQNQYEIFPCKIEDFHTDKKYDIVIAEGFLPYIFNQNEVIKKLQSLTDKEGIIVITCVDNVGMFIEAIKRLIGQMLTRNITCYDEKLNYLVQFFGKQLEGLGGVSRSAKDWVQDQILNPAGINGMELSMAQAISMFENDYEILGSSPQMFTDYSWYKDVCYDYKESYRQQFEQKRLSLLMTNMPEKIMDKADAEVLVQHFQIIKKLAAEYEKDKKEWQIDEILRHMKEMKALIRDLDQRFFDVFLEIEDALMCAKGTGIVDMKKYNNFFSAFGRAQQYIAFVKK